MPIPENIMLLVPEEIRSFARGYYNKAQDAYYFYRLDGVHYDKTKKRGIDARTPLGRVRHGAWKYSSAYLHELELSRQQEKLKQAYAGSDRDRLEQPKVAQTVKTITAEAANITDERSQLRISYRLDHLAVVMFLAALGGYTSAASIAAYWLRFARELSLMLPGFNPAPISHDTVNRLMRKIKPSEFETFLKCRLAADLVKGGRIICVDGQAVRATKTDDLKSGRYFFNIYDSVNHVLLTQELIDAKDNEISVAVEVLSRLDIGSGDIITADAMGTQRRLVDFLNERGAGWCLALKNNQPSLHQEVMMLFSQDWGSRLKSYRSDYEAAHGRIEKRQTDVLPGRLLSPRFTAQWPGLEQGCLIMTRTQSIKAGGIGSGSETDEIRYFISSIQFTKDAADCAGECAAAVRQHWSVEAFHWIADVVFKQDAIQCRDDNYLNNRVILNKIAISTLSVIKHQLRRKTGTADFSINILKEMCSTPLAALELLAQNVETANIMP